jgi:pimeloyl-ACP methyl ester carboxylesterase
VTDPPDEHPEWARYRRPVQPPEASEDSGGSETPDPVDPDGAPIGEAAPAPEESEPAPHSPSAAPPSPSAAPAGAGWNTAAAALLGAVPKMPAADAPASTWDPGEAIPNELEVRIRRDLVRGRKIVWLTWVAALASLVLGLVAVRQATLLVAIDRRLVTTEEVEAAGAAFDIARSVLIAAVVLGLLLALRWLRGALPVMAELHRRGVVDGPAPRTERPLDRLRLLWRPSGVPAERAGWADLRVGDGRRVAWFAAGFVGLATIVGLIAAIWLGAAQDADTSRLLRIVSGIDGGLWLVASVLVGVAFDAILWREAAAARALGVFIPLVDAPSRALVRILPPILLFGAGVLVASVRPEPWFVPCPEATLQCDGMLVPVDHGGGSHATIWVVYAVHRAAVSPTGTLAIAVGGPGGSGLDESIAILDTLDEELVRRYDILFFDQRGVGASEGRDCPEAGATYATAVPGADAARAFAEGCIRESGVDPATLARYATHQAAEDLDSIRDRLGIERFALYGESYGTELAQEYAAAHPDRLTGLILDGAVDRTRPANDFWISAKNGFARALADTLDACTEDARCGTDVADPDRAYDALLGSLDVPLAASYADPDGVVRTHTIDAAAFESAIDALLYEPSGRMLIQRAVAAASRGDTVPAARLVDALGTGEGVGASSFAYHAITCADYRVSPTADPHDLAAVEAAGTAASVGVARTDEIYTTQFPCLFWPYQPADGTRPAPLRTTPFPVFVLAATDDPITPAEQGRAIAGRLSDGYLIVTRGGPHVTFGRGDPCVDRPVLDFLLEARRPASRSIDCDGEVADPYIPLSPETAAGIDDALEAMVLAESELFADPDYQLWDGEGDLRIGCRHGGFVTITPATLQDGIRFVDCAYLPGYAITGSGTYVFASSTVSWSVTVPEGELVYRADDAGRHVGGTWKGARVDLSD